MLKRVCVFLPISHIRALNKLARPRGLRTAQYIRRAIAEFLSRERRKQAAQIAVPVRKRRSAVLLGE